MLFSCTGDYANNHHFKQTIHAMEENSYICMSSCNTTFCMHAVFGRFSSLCAPWLGGLYMVQ